MHSTLKLRDSDPHDDFAIVPEVVPAAWADKVLADITRDDGVHPEVKRSADGRSPASDRQASAASVVAVAAPTVDARFRATATDDSSAPVEQPSTSRWVKSAVLLVFAIGSAAAAAAWQNHGDAARQMISNWVPAFAVTSSPPTETAALAEQPDAPGAQPVAAEQTPEPAAAEQTPEPAAAPAQPAESAAPAAAAPSPDTLQLESMARDLAAMAQQVEQLKASIAELKTSQQAMVREAAKVSEAKAAETRPAAPNPRPRVSSRPPRSAAAPPRRPLSAYPPAQAAAPLPQPAPPPVSTLPAPPPPQATARTEDDEPIVRPPMPLR
jgi:hypothetical protein